MSQKERNEWIERAKERVLRNAKETDTYARDIMDLYDETANQLENEINAMFQKYAQDNKLDNAEAEKLLSGEEYSRWRKSMDKYVAEAQTDSRTLLELNTLSAKSRISRKEQLLSQIYLQMINLAGDTETKLTDLLGDMFKTNYYRSCYDIQSIMGVGFTVAKVDEKMLKRILEFPWSGKNYSQALWEDTARLPEVEIKKPDSILARETISSMQAGLVYGQIGQTEYIINQVKKETGITDLKVVATGGLGRIIADETDTIDIYDSALTLDGLRILYEKNCSGK